MKILHSADWHLGSPLQGRTDAQAQPVRRALLSIPGQIAALCKSEQCDLMLLSGDLFDGACSYDVVLSVQTALAEAGVPVLIAPGNHDFIGMDSPYNAESWPENVHIFRQNRITSVPLPRLDCRVYGAAFTSPDCGSILEGFAAAGEERYQIGVFHGDPTQIHSPYCPITQPQVSASGLSYLALGHIHKGGSFSAGGTLCGWPGCPVGRGFDELGEKGVYIVTLEESVSLRFVALDAPRFFDLELPVEGTPEKTVAAALPAVGSSDFYRITLTGESEKPDLSFLQARFSRFPNLELRDRTVPPTDPWVSVGEDSFEGAYFSRLQTMLEDCDEHTRRRILLAAKISRQILDGQEVPLP